MSKSLKLYHFSQFYAIRGKKVVKIETPRFFQAVRFYRRLVFTGRACIETPQIAPLFGYSFDSAVQHIRHRWQTKYNTNLRVSKSPTYTMFIVE